MSALDGAVAAVEAVGTRLGQVDVRLALVALAFHVLNHGLRSVAWRNVLGAAYPHERVRLLDVGAAYATGVALNAVLPGRGGDAAKIAILRGRLPGSSVPTIASSMSVIVLFDAVAATVLVLVAALTGLVPFAPRLPSAAAAPGWLAAHWAVVVGVAAAAATLVALAGRRLRPRLRDLRVRLVQGGAILRAPGRYASGVALVQGGAWCCRIAVVFFLLAAFGLHASIATAAVVMVVSGLSTLVPLTPGGAGTQQVMLAYALQQTATAAAAVSFSLGMQAGVTVVNALLGVVAAMVVFRTLRPLGAVRAGVRLARGERAAA